MTSMTVSNNMPRHVVVIGAGIVGASIAWRVASRGARVTIIDKGEPGSGASSHSFAWINAGAKEPVGYHNLNRRSLEMWPRFADALGEDVGLRWGGKVSWEVEPEAAKALVARVEQLQSWGYPSRLVSREELQELEPALNIGPVVAADYNENEGQVEPQMVVDACLNRLRELEASIVTGVEVTGLRTDSQDRVTSVQTTAGGIDADVVVVAAGTATTAVAAMAGVNVPQAESPGVVMRTSPMPSLLQNVPVIYAPPLEDGRSEIHLRQCPDGRFMIGEGDQESLAEDDSQAHADDLLARACRHLPGLVRRDGRPRARRLATHAPGRLPGAGIRSGGPQPLRCPHPQRGHAGPGPEPTRRVGDLRRRPGRRRSRPLPPRAVRRHDAGGGVTAGTPPRAPPLTGAIPAQPASLSVQNGIPLFESTSGTGIT